MNDYAIKRWLLAMPRSLKRLMAMLHDAFFCAFTLWLAICLRMETWASWDGAYLTTLVVSVVLALPLFAYFGVYRAVFRFSGWHAMLSLVKAIGVYNVMYVTVFTVVSVTGVPRRVGICKTWSRG